MQAGKVNPLIEPGGRSGRPCGCSIVEQVVSLGISLAAAAAVAIWLVGVWPVGAWRVGAISWLAIGCVFVPTFLLILGVSGCVVGAQPRQSASARRR